MFDNYWVKVFVAVTYTDAG